MPEQNFKWEEQQQELQDFLDEANKAGYAGGEERQWIKEADKSTTIVFEKGLYKYHDNFFGGEPYGGREVVFYNDSPVWMMVYYGEITDKSLDKKEVYAVLQEALKAGPEAGSFRGPKSLVKEKDGRKWEYLNTWSGDLPRFSGRELILADGQEIYYANYSGGWVDRQKEEFAN